MQQIGIEAMGFYGGSACIDVGELAVHRRLDMARFENLLMKQKTVALTCEDPVSFAVNAAKRVVDGLDAAEKDRVELLITCTESGIDFGKSMSTYVHHYLGLNRNCRMFELKQACYSGVAGLQMAMGFLLSGMSPGAKALVVATDVSRYVVVDGTHAEDADWSFAEPSSGAGSVAMLVGGGATVFVPDVGASGCYGYEVMDTCRPVPDSEAGNADLSLMSYLDCCEQSFIEYCKRVPGAHYGESFNYLAFHTPFGGMVKGAHRAMQRKFQKADPKTIEADFERRVRPGLRHCQRVGNIMGGTAALSLLSTIDNGEFPESRRIGVFSYGSGCCSEFFSGVVTPEGQRRVRALGVSSLLDGRRRLSMAEYDALLRQSHRLKFGTQNVVLDDLPTRGPGEGPTLFLRRIDDFHRIYEWR
jgi:polyketide biosynthesis 3-hydroxy-3-methylglutaryl-CoA synthase-like enzyme PksG